MGMRNPNLVLDFQNFELDFFHQWWYQLMKPVLGSVDVFEKFNRTETDENSEGAEPNRTEPNRVIKELNCNRENTTTDFDLKLIL